MKAVPVFERLKSHLVADWAQALKWSSVRLHLAAAAIALIYSVMPALDPGIAGILPLKLQAKAIGVYALGGLLLRMTKLKVDG